MRLDERARRYERFCEAVRREVAQAQARSPGIHLDIDRELWLAVWRQNECRTLWPHCRDLTAAELVLRWQPALDAYAFGCCHLRDAIAPPRFIEVEHFTNSGAPGRIHLHVTAHVPRLPLGRRRARWDPDVGVWLRTTCSVAQRPHRTYSTDETQVLDGALRVDDPASARTTRR